MKHSILTATLLLTGAFTAAPSLAVMRLPKAPLV